MFWRKSKRALHLKESRFLLTSKYLQWGSVKKSNYQPEVNLLLVWAGLHSGHSQTKIIRPFPNILLNVFGRNLRPRPREKPMPRERKNENCRTCGGGQSIQYP